VGSKGYINIAKSGARAAQKRIKGAKAAKSKSKSRLHKGKKGRAK
jgi:hypothetical protein